MGAAAFQHDPVRRNEVSGSELDHVAGHQPVDRDGDDGAVAADVRMHRDGALQCLGGAFGPVLLNEVECDRENDDGDDDAEAGEVPRRARDRGGDQQDRDQRLGKSSGDLAEDIEPRGLGDTIRAVAG